MINTVIKLSFIVLTGSLLLLIAGFPAISSVNDGKDDFIIVDCLLPGQIRKLGKKAVFQTARRPIRITAWTRILNKECGNSPAVIFIFMYPTKKCLRLNNSN